MQSSSYATRLFKEIAAEDKGGEKRRAEARPSRRKLALTLASSAAGLVLLTLLLILFRTSARPQSEGKLILDLPENRAELAIRIDGAPLEVPASGPLEYAGRSGKHTVSATRPGYRPLEQVVTLETGRKLKAEMAWVVNFEPRDPLAQCRAVGALLEIDGASQDISAMARRSTTGELECTLKPGIHKLRCGV